MRFFPVLTAALVCVALFFVVLQRDALLGFARSVTGGPEDEAPATAPESASVPVAIATSEAAGEVPVNVVALRSRAREVPDAVLVRGQSAAARQVSVLAEISGSVISEPIRKGAFVEQGDVLCEIDPGTSKALLAEAEARLAEARARVPETQARIVEAQARLEEARLNQTAAERLGDRGFASTNSVATADAALSAARASVTAAETGLETTQAGIQAAEAQVARARLDIERLTMKAPFSGVLETDTAELGTYLQAGAPGGNECATIVQLDPIKLVGFLPETQVDRVSTGAEAAARLASGQEVRGQVTFLSRSADDLTRTFRVEVTVPNPDLAIRDGQTVEIVISTPATTAHLIPASALTLDDEGRLGVRTVQDGRAGFVPVTLVRDTVDGVLLSGLPETADVITVGQEYVTDGVPVQASFTPPGASE